MTLFLVHNNFNVSRKIVLSLSQLTFTDADRRFSSWQTFSSKRQNTLRDVRVDKRDLELSFGGLNYSFSLFSYIFSIEIIRASVVLERHLLKLSIDMMEQTCNNSDARIYQPCNFKLYKHLSLLYITRSN